MARGRRFVFEFRNPDWFRDEALALLEKHHSGFCIHDMAGMASPEALIGDLAYVRLHGPDGAYAGCYSDGALDSWAGKINGWSRAGKRVFCYFNNDAGGWAPINALALKERLEK